MAQEIFGTLDPDHPGVATFTNLGRYMLSGSIEVLNLPVFPSGFSRYPARRRIFAVRLQSEVGKGSCFSALCNPMHRAHESCVAWLWSV